MDRLQALEELDKHLKNKNLIRHSLAVEAVMRALAKHFDEDGEIWGMAGLLHDLDYEDTENDWTQHGVLTEQWLSEYDLSAETINIIKAHNADAIGITPETRAEKAIYAIDPLTGLITAAALMQPSRKIADLSPHSVLKKYKNKKFAAGASREHIATCENFGLPLEKFIEISLTAMQGICSELGL